MHCPRCRQQVTADDDFCRECGHQLAAAEAVPEDVAEPGPEPQSTPARLAGFLARLAGRTRRERFVTAGIVVAIAVAAAAFVQLRSDGDEAEQASAGGPGGYLAAADEICTAGKLATERAATESASGVQRGTESIREYIGVLAKLAARTARQLKALNPPAELRRQAERLNSLMSRLARNAKKASTAFAKDAETGLGVYGEVIRIGSKAETTIAELGLQQCASLQVTARG